jgi:hypothetical protein
MKQRVETFDAPGKKARLGPGQFCLRDAGSTLWPLRAILCALIFLGAQKAFALGTEKIVSEQPEAGGFRLFAGGAAAEIVAGTNDWPGVRRAAGDLQKDIVRVSGVTPKISSDKKISGKNVVIIGTIGKSELIDRLVRAGKISVSEVTGKWESFFIQTVPQPFPGVDNALVICGSDKRGTIYGIYELSEQIGVSPWHYWADVTSAHHDQLFVKPGKFLQGPPSVKYRGIFLNDEAPDLTGWVQEKFGRAPGWTNSANYGPAFYTNLFEVILRCRGNYLWPAMWNNAFNEDDTNNPALADLYGIVMGTSHQEPMLRAQKEWDRNFQKANGNWNYNNTNQRPVLENFWRDGVRRNKNYESIITLGLRAENDSGAELGKDLTEQVIGVQRNILSEEINSDLTKVPQMWCLYKEVMGYYNDGLRVPDDVTLLWAEDNWGNVRRLPTADERKRSGGTGIYYHFDYHGGPRSYQWLNTSPLPKIWDQMSLAKQYGADRIWIVNVGHFKGYELQMEFFLNLGWNTERWNAENLGDFTKLWAAREFGNGFADDIADVVSKYAKYNGRRKPELVDAQTYSVVNYREFETVVDDWDALAKRAQAISDKLPAEKRAAFYELVLFPVKACAQLNEMYFAAAKNNLYAAQGRASANEFAGMTRYLFAVETNLFDEFNQKFMGGKWNHFMDQGIIGYRTWVDPHQNNLDAVDLTEVQVPEVPAMGVAVEGSEVAVTNGEVSLPQFDSFNRQKFYVEIFNRGKGVFNFKAEADKPWINFHANYKQLALTNGLTFSGGMGGTIGTTLRLWVEIYWDKAPVGTNSGKLKISGAGEEVTVNVNTFNPVEPARDSLQGFVEGEGFVSIELEHFYANKDAGKNRWVKLPDYGRTLSGMRATAPVDAAAAVPGKDSPSLEYKMFLFNTHTVQVVAVTSPVLNFMPGRAVRYAVSFDDEPPQTIALVPEKYSAGNGNADWENSVKNNARVAKSAHEVGATGWHTLKFWMVDPGVVLQKIVVNTGGLKPNYLGPPESFHRQGKASPGNDGL